MSVYLNPSELEFASTLPDLLIEFVLEGEGLIQISIVWIPT